MLKHILPLIPSHKIYTEAFCGGAAVLFAKRPAEAEVINDINMELTNFYWMAGLLPGIEGANREDAAQPGHSCPRWAHQQLPAVLYASRARVGRLGALQDVVRFDDRWNVRVRLRRYDAQEVAQCEGRVYGAAMYST